jgi:hypothetical protein
VGEEKADKQRFRKKEIGKKTQREESERKRQLSLQRI